jgi:hypothetical protein
MVSGRGRFRGNLLRQHPPQFQNRRVAGDDSVTKCSLLPIQPFSQFGVLLFQLAETADVGAIGCTDQMREHVHFAERIADHIARCGRMGKRGPVRTRNLAAAHGVAPE